MTGGAPTGPPLGVIPAAGQSKRMGGSAKPLLDTDHGTFLERTVRALREGGCDPVVVGVRDDPGPVAAHARELGCTVLVPPGVEDGPVATLRAALDQTNLPPAVVYLPVDMPLVRPETVRALLDAWRAADPRTIHLVLPIHRGRTGHPAFFSGPLLQELGASDLPDGARTVVDRHRDGPHYLPVEVDDRGVGIDIDTVPEYRRHFPQAFRRRFQKW